ncbi:DNA/RNA helicase, superfamily I [Natrinema thermotolerans DSM 11552]|nr:DNA/RNA helicase, superfamily I [Natrinema thermotolerans DSM 11552]
MPPGVSETPFEDVVSSGVYRGLDAGLQDGSVHGLDTASVDDSVLLWGPPGAGKTTESLARVAGYVDEHEDVSPRDVTVVTYRGKLAESIKTRAKDWDIFPFVDDLEKPYEYWGTGHAVATRVTDFLGHIDGDSPGHAGMVDGSAARAFCDEHGIEYRTGVKWQDSQWDVFHDLYCYCKQNLLDVGSWRHITDDDLLGTVRTNTIAYRKLQAFHDKWGSSSSFERAVQAWEAWKRDQQCYDFYEQLEAGLAAGLPGDEFVVIDELHDAYPLMTMLFEQWIDAAGTAVAAGDPDQVCNAFSGASREIFQGLPARVDTEIPTVKLPKSHRVPDEHFEAAASILSRHHTPPELETAGGGKIYRHTTDMSMEHDTQDGWRTFPATASQSPLRLHETYGADMIHAARTQTLVDGIGACLDEGGVVYQSQDGVAGDWARRLRLLHVLRTVRGVRPAQQVSVVGDGDEYGRDSNTDRDVSVTTPDAADVSLSPEQARVLLKHTDEGYLDVSRSDALERVNEREMEQNRLSRVTMPVLADMVSREWWAVYGQGVESIENLVYLNARAGFTGNRDRDVTAMRAAWDRYGDDLPETPSDVETRLWTLHAAKGDEAEHAVVYTGVTGKVRDGVREDERQAANESRTWYVGMTRATDGLHIVRDAFDMTCDNFEVVPGDLEPEAVKAARERRRERREGDGPGEGTAAG